MGDLPGEGAAAEVKPVASNPTSFPAQDLPEIGGDQWAAAERAANQIIRRVQPNSVSEVRRKEVVDYIHRLIKNRLGAEVYPYGSVPLKTYLPDGDIDLTAFGGPNAVETLADDMKTILEEVEKNPSAEFVVKDVQLVRAEVKLVKCIIQDIVVDVSFNQIGGLCALCFLEQVDRSIGKNNLFKRSIILIKAWCYYESRILGAHHGLISTYALETLVLYIFNHFHSTLDGPLTVLFKFLDYFSKFDWETYCISLKGPVPISALPAIAVEMPADSDKRLLLSDDFLSLCASMFSVPSSSRGADRNSRGFQHKHLDIFDPLKESNNLGRSVSKGNFYRIRSAFSYGARKLAQILVQPADSIVNELHKFFSNTMARHGGGQRPDVQNFDPSLIPNRPISSFPIRETELCKNCENFAEYDISDIANTKQISNSDGLATSALRGLQISTNNSVRETSFANEAGSAVGRPYYHAPHLYFTKSKLHNGSTRDKNPDSDKTNKCEPKDVYRAQKALPFSGDSNHMDSDEGSVSCTETPESLNLLDLSGDFQNFLRFLQYGRLCYESSLGLHSLPFSPLSTTAYQNNSPWEGFLPLSHYKQSEFSHRHHNGVHPSSALYTGPPVLVPAVSLGWEELPKPRGTGTYFPNMSQTPQGYRPSSVTKGRDQAPANSPRNNERRMIFTEPNISCLDLSQSQARVDKNASVSLSDSYQPFSPRRDTHPNANAFFIKPEGVAELESTGTSVSDKSKQHKPLQRSKSSLTREQDRILLRSSYRLKDEDDFPPLPV